VSGTTRFDLVKETDMEEIELRPAESYAVAGPSLRFVLRVELNNSTEIFVDVPGGRLRRGHTKIVVQGIEESTSVTLSKPDGLAFESGTRVFITLDQLVDAKTGEVVSVSLPPYVLSGRKRFTPVSIPEVMVNTRSQPPIRTLLVAQSSVRALT